MRKIMIIAVSLLLTFDANAQMTLIQRDNSAWYMEVVNLKLSGKKYMTFDNANSQVRFYNLNHSLWKTINLPPTIGGLTRSPFNVPLYPSENLFKLDNKVDMAVIYSSSVVIIDETGAVINTIDSVQGITIYNAGMTTDSFVAIATGTAGFSSVYLLPGTIPCNLCGNGLGLAKALHSDDNGDLSDPAPNPSSSQTKLTYTLPEGSSKGEISIYSANGELVKTYKVDKTFSYITIDNSILPAGIYYYNLIADGNVTMTKKMLVIK